MTVFFGEYRYKPDKGRYGLVQAMAAAVPWYGAESLMQLISYRVDYISRLESHQRFWK